MISEDCPLRSPGGLYLEVGESGLPVVRFGPARRCFRACPTTRSGLPERSVGRARESVRAGPNERTRRPGRVDGNRQESTGVGLSVRRGVPIGNCPLACKLRAKHRSLQLDSCRFPSIPVDSACAECDATSRRVYKRGHVREGLRAGLLSCRWDYASERSAAKSHHVWDSSRDSLMQRRYF